MTQAAPMVETVSDAAPGDVVPAVPPAGPGKTRGRFTLLAASHAMIDVFPIFFVSLMLVLEERLALSSVEKTAVYMITPIFSGGLQPVFARLTDRFDTRLCSPLGLAIGAVTIASIGFAQSFWQLVALQIVGVIATGMYHPISTALAGQIGSRTFRNGRAQAIGVFIAAGMIGQSAGPTIATRVTDEFGIHHLAWLIIPALLIAIALHVVLSRTPHRSHDHHEQQASRPIDETRARWRWVFILAASNAMRFTANVGMFVMYNAWADAHVRLDPDALARAQAAENPASVLAQTGANFSANLSTSMTIGMGLSVLAMGRLVARGREQGPLLYLALFGAVAMAMIGFAGDAAVSAFGLSWWSLAPAYLCAALAPIGFFGTFPLATSMAQRLLPEHTSLVTALMMGVGWAISASSALLAQAFFGFVDLKAAAELPTWRINLGFVGFAVILAAAGLLTIVLPRRAFSAAADAH